MNCVFPLLLAACVSTALAAAPATAPKLPDSFDVKAIDAFLAAYMQQPGHVGLSVVILKDGEVALARGYGKRSLADGRPVQPDTLFAIGSVSKQFTCACILLLAEEGRLSVHDSVAKDHPDLTRANDITLLDLMHHVSGYPDYYPLDFVDRRMAKAIKSDELLRPYAGGKLDFEPGTRWSYSNTGFIVLGRVVEKVAGEPFATFLAGRIFKPLGMEHSVYEPAPSDPRLAEGYTSFALSDPEAVAPEAKGWAGAAGAIYSTPGDLAKWDLALLDGRVLKPESLKILTTPRQLKGGKMSDYACGLSIRPQNGRMVWAHNGAVSGFATSSALVPSTRSAVIMTCNLDGGLGALPGQLLALLLKDPSNVPVIKGLPAAETAKALFAQLQSGRVDRTRLAEEFNLYLTDDKVTAAARRLKSYGTPERTEVTTHYERGGMEVTVTRLAFKKGVLRALMYRQPGGAIEQFFVSKD